MGWRPDFRKERYPFYPAQSFAIHRGRGRGPHSGFHPRHGWFTGFFRSIRGNSTLLYQSRIDPNRTRLTSPPLRVSANCLFPTPPFSNSDIYGTTVSPPRILLLLEMFEWKISRTKFVKPILRLCRHKQCITSCVFPFAKIKKQNMTITFLLIFHFSTNS